MTTTLYDLLLAVEDGSIREFLRTVRPESKSAVLLRYLLHLKEKGLTYDHGRAVCHVYGVRRNAGEYRKKYTAFMRMNERLCSRLEAFVQRHSERGMSPTLEYAMTEAEKLYYRARALFNEGQFSRAASLLKEAAHRAPAECCEVMVFQITALHSRAIDKLCLFDELSESDVKRSPDLLARAVCNLFWQYQYYGAHLLRKEKSEQQLAQLEAEYTAMASHPLMSAYAAVFEMMSLELRERYAFTTGNTAPGSELQARVRHSQEACRGFGLSFQRSSRVPIEGCDPTEYYKQGMTAIANDQLEEAADFFAAIADYYEAGKGTFEHIQALHISILFAIGRLEAIPREVERLRTYAAQHENIFYSGLADYYSARHELYGSELRDPEKTISSILRFEYLCDDNPLGQMSLLRTKAKFYYRTGDVNALDAVASQLRSRRYATLSVQYIRQFVALLLGTMDYQATGSPALKSRLDRRRRELLVLKPGERYIKGFLADWLNRFCSAPEKPVGSRRKATIPPEIVG